VNRSIGGGVSVPWCTPVDELRLGDREADAQPGPSGLQPRVLLLYYLDVPPIGRGGDGYTEVVHIGEGETMGDLTGETGNVDNKQQRRDWGPLGGAHRNWGEHPGASLVEELARPAGEKRPGPRHEIRVDPFGSKNAAEGGGVHVVETPFYVQEERGDLPSSHLEGLYLVGKGGDRV